jgi:hypothetical protein
MILCSRRLAMRLVHLFDFYLFVIAVDLIMLSSSLLSSNSSSSLLLSGDQKFVSTRYVCSVLILRFITPGCHVSATSVPAHLQVLFADFQFDGHDSLFFSNSQQSSSAFVGCFSPQCLQIGASLYFFHFSSLFFFFSSSVSLVGLVGFLLSLISNIISFMVLVVLLINVSICLVCASVNAAMSSSVASTCSSIAFALNCFVVSLLCLFSLAYSVEMKVLMLVHVLSAAGFASHSLTAASNSPVTLR